MHVGVLGLCAEVCYACRCIVLMRRGVLCV